MLTPNGIRVLEFNCRFGDPETQVVLPLLETDLVEIAEACVDGRLNQLNIQWKDEAAVCVVLASKGYPEKPEKGQVVSFGELPEDMICFHAGTKQNGTDVITAGGRVFGLTAWADDIESAIDTVYANIKNVSFDGMQYRTDIAHRALS
jgi:phosphoribosylamine--glycine ligase